MSTRSTIPAHRVAGAPRNGHPRAHLRLRGAENIPTAAMLEAVERVRDALTRLGIDDLRIELVDEDAEGDPTA